MDMEEGGKERVDILDSGFDSLTDDFYVSSVVMLYTI